MKPTIRLPETVKKTIAVDPKEWVWVPGTTTFIYIPQQYKGLQWRQALTTVQKQTPFRVTPPDIFSPHYANVCASVRKRNPEKIYDGNHEPLSRSARDELCDLRTSKTWIWLDAYFRRIKGELVLETDHRLVDEELQPQTQRSLEQYIKDNDTLVDLRFNRQGLPIKKSTEQIYTRGRNMHFWRPAKDCVARFCIYTDGASLDCDGDPRDSDAALGVLLCYAPQALQKYK